MSTQLSGMRGPDDDDDVADLVQWQRLEEHVRCELQLEGDGKLEVALQHEALSSASSETPTVGGAKYQTLRGMQTPQFVRDVSRLCGWCAMVRDGPR
jgi:hypothetical protein